VIKLKQGMLKESHWEIDLPVPEFRFRKWKAMLTILLNLSNDTAYRPQDQLKTPYNNRLLITDLSFRLPILSCRHSTAEPWFYDRKEFHRNKVEACPGRAVSLHSSQQTHATPQSPGWRAPPWRRNLSSPQARGEVWGMAVLSLFLSFHRTV